TRAHLQPTQLRCRRKSASPSSGQHYVGIGERRRPLRRFVVINDFGTDVGSDEFNDRRRLRAGERTQEQRFHRRIILQQQKVRVVITGHTRSQQHGGDPTCPTLIGKAGSGPSSLSSLRRLTRTRRKQSRTPSTFFRPGHLRTASSAANNTAADHPPASRYRRKSVSDGGRSEQLRQ